VIFALANNHEYIFSW